MQINTVLFLITSNNSYKNYACSKFFSESMPRNTVETSKKDLDFFTVIQKNI